MAQPFHWPPTTTDIEAIDLDHEVVAPDPRRGPSPVAIAAVDKSAVDASAGEDIDSAPAAVKPVPAPRSVAPWARSHGSRSHASVLALAVVAIAALVGAGWLVLRVTSRTPTVATVAPLVAPPSAAPLRPSPNVIPAPVLSAADASNATKTSAPRASALAGPVVAEHPPTVVPPASPVPVPVVPALAPGAVSIALAFQVQVYEHGQFIGMNDRDRLPLAAGPHDLEFVNDSLHYRATQHLTISTGRTSTVKPKLPTSALNVNATPWAEVFLDGQSLGETPLGNVQVPIGPHRLVFRHPQLGEQTQSIVVTVGDAAHASADLQK